MSRRVVAIIAIIAGAVLVLSGCGSSSSSSGGGKGDPYRVLVTGGLSASGVLAANAKTSVIAAQAGAAMVNASGGVAGRKVEVTVVDDGGNPTTAVTELRKAISEHKPDLYLNSGPSQIAAATLSLLKQNKILSFNIGPTTDSDNPGKYPLNFDLSPSATDYAKGFVAYAKKKGYTSIGLLHGGSSYGMSFGKESKAAFEKAGLSVVDVEQYDTKALDMTPQLQAIQSHHPDALVIDAYGPPVGYLLKSLGKLGWDVPVLADNSVSATGLISTPAPSGLLGTDKVKNLMMEVFTSTVYNEGDATVNKAVAAMKKKGKIPSTLINAYNYDAIPLVAAAARKAGKADDPSALATALENRSTQKKAKVAILKGYHFTSKSHSPNLDANAFLFIKPSPLKDGQFHTKQ